MVAAGFGDVGKDTDQPRGAVSSPGTDGDPVVCARQEADRPTCDGEWPEPRRVHDGISPAPEIARRARGAAFHGRDGSSRLAERTRAGVIRPARAPRIQPMERTSTRGGYPFALRAAAVVVPAALLSALILFRYFVLDVVVDRSEATIITIIIGVTGVVAFSVAIFTRLSQLHERDQEQNARLRALAHDLEERRQTMEALNEAGMALSVELDSAAVLQKIVDLAKGVANARYAALGIFGADGAVTQFITAGITAEQRARIGPLPRGRGVLGVLPRDGRPLRLRDLKDHPESVRFPPHHPPMRSFLGVPILWRGHSVGNLYLTEKQGADEFTPEDEKALLTFAAQAAIAIENARLYEQLERIAVLEERQRIGMDLHDGAIQSLYGIGLILEDAAERVTSEPAASRATVGRAVDRLNATIADLRSYVLGLAPVRSSSRPLAESLPELAAQLAANALLEVHVDVAPHVDDGLEPTFREAAFFVAADALTNIARHARARRASVRAWREHERLVLQVEDDGVGFDPNIRAEGLGLRNMRQRAFSAGGWLVVDSAPGKGSRVRVELPVRKEVRA